MSKLGGTFMAIEETSTRTRRSLLAAAAGAAGALAAAAAVPASIHAADPDDVVKGVDNATTATTSVTNGAADLSTALAGHTTGTGAGFGLEGTSTATAGVVGWSVSAPDWGDITFDPTVIANSGVYGWAPEGDGETTLYGTGVWGDSPDTGVFGTGSTGVWGYGGFGVAGQANSLSGSVGVFAIATSNSTFALWAEGKVHFKRSGRKSVSSGKSSVSVTLSGVTSSSKVFAVLATSESGRWVRAAVPASGKFTVYFNASLRSSASVSWFVLD
jgi:hypothetical protein